MKIKWNDDLDKAVGVGLDRGVLYVKNKVGVPWNGLISFVESPSGGDAQSYYVDGTKVLSVANKEEFVGRLQAFYSPAEFDICDGSVEVSAGVFGGQQYRESFDLAFRTKKSNETYELHLIYNAKARPSERAYVTIGDTIEPLALEWELFTKPVIFPGLENTSHLTIHSNKTPIEALMAIDEIIYGSSTEEPRMISVEEVFSLFGGYDIIVTDNLDDTFTIEGSDAAVYLNPDGSYTITSDEVVYLEEDQYFITSS